MEKTRFHVGMENLKKIDGKGGEAVIQSLKTISPDLGKYIVEFAFGDIYERDGLSLQEREMITLASLPTAGRCEPQLEVHIDGALNVGITPESMFISLILPQWVKMWLRRQFNQTDNTATCQSYMPKFPRIIGLSLKACELFQCSP